MLTWTRIANIMDLRAFIEQKADEFSIQKSIKKSLFTTKEDQPAQGQSIVQVHAQSPADDRGFTFENGSYKLRSEANMNHHEKVLNWLDGLCVPHIEHPLHSEKADIDCRNTARMVIPYPAAVSQTNTSQSSGAIEQKSWRKYTRECLYGYRQESECVKWDQIYNEPTASAVNQNLPIIPYPLQYRLPKLPDLSPIEKSYFLD